MGKKIVYDLSNSGGTGQLNARSPLERPIKDPGTSMVKEGQSLHANPKESQCQDTKVSKSITKIKNDKVQVMKKHSNKE